MRTALARITTVTFCTTLALSAGLPAVAQDTAKQAVVKNALESVGHPIKRFGYAESLGNSRVKASWDGCVLTITDSIPSFRMGKITVPAEVETDVVDFSGKVSAVDTGWYVKLYARSVAGGGKVFWTGSSAKTKQLSQQFRDIRDSCGGSIDDETRRLVDTGRYPGAGARWRAILEQSAASGYKQAQDLLAKAVAAEAGSSTPAAASPSPSAPASASAPVRRADVSSPSASSGGQTVAGAQDFMRLAMTNGSTRLYVPLANGSENYVQWTEDRKQTRCEHEGGIFGSTHCRPRVVGTRTLGSTRTLNIGKVTTTDSCTTVVEYWITPKYTNDITYVPGLTTISWRNVTEAKQSGQSVALSGQSVRFVLSSEDLAARFAYAATFLRDACDPTARTGF